MSKVLDLTTFIEETLDVKMPDGTQISLKKPTEKMVIAMINMRDKAESKDPIEQMKSISDMILLILNSNTNGKKFSAEDIEDLSIPMRTAIIRSYSNYITGLQSDPN
jgi:hypothetical protein